jgi:hypothetical protein
MSDFYYTASYDVEFNDSVLDLKGWKNPRYEGTKLVAREINRFTPPLSSGSLQPVGGRPLYDDPGRARYWGGDISYGLNPVIEQDVCALYIGSTITNGDEDSKVVNIEKHSYCVIDKFLLINPHTDEVKIVDRLNTDASAFKRFIQTDFPEGSRCKFKLTDFFHPNALKPNYSVKFNEGLLMKVYSYTPNTDNFDDGVFGCFGVRSQKGNHVDNLASSSRSGFTGAVLTNNTLNADAVIPGGADNTNRTNHTSDGKGLFSFGMTACDSASLFNTNSIQFVNPFPDELSEYIPEVDMSTLGEMLNPCTASYQTIVGGGSVTDNYDQVTQDFSDIRLKHNYEIVGTSLSGIPIYIFSYIGETTKYIGTMAQDLLRLGRGDAVSVMNNGYFGVNYSKIDIDLKKLIN